MNKSSFTKVGIFALLSMLLIPNAAALPGVSLQAGDHYIWRLDQIAEEGGEVETSVAYQKLNISEILESTDNIFVNYTVYDADEADYLAFGWENASIWGESINSDDQGYLNESVPSTHYKYYFNEQNADMTAITEESILLLSVQSNPAIWIVYAIMVAFGVGFGQYTEVITINSTTINAVADRTLNFDMELFTALEEVANPGRWLNMTIQSHQELVYSETSNILLESKVESTFTMLGYNTTLATHITDSFSYNINTTLIYPQSVVDDVPVDGGGDGDGDGEGGLGELLANIPGYSGVYLGVAAIAGIFFVLKKRK